MAQLRTDQKVVLLHYAPIHATCVGEPEEIIDVPVTLPRDTSHEGRVASRQ